MSDPKPLKELTRYWTAANAKEMARRLRALDKYITEAQSKHGIWVSATRVRAILDGGDK